MIWRNILAKVTKPPLGINESIKLLIAPHIVAVVATVNRADCAQPNLISFPSKFGCVLPKMVLMAGLPLYSPMAVVIIKMMKIMPTML